MNYRCKPVLTIAKSSWLGISLAISITACTSSKTLTQVPAAPIPTPAIPAVAPAPIPAPPNQSLVYEQALSKADAATAIGQSAISKDDWFLVANNLKESVQMLRSIDHSSAQYILAAKVLPKYEQQLNSATRKAANFTSKSTPTANRETAVAPATTTAALPQRETFSIPIQQKLGGVPVIEVTMNNQKVSMLMDTGASHTLITPSIARQLQLPVEGTSKASTANGTATFDNSTINRVKFGAGEVTNLRVSIGQDNLPYGLLGHDVYDGYDITIKESSIEFRRR